MYDLPASGKLTQGFYFLFWDLDDGIWSSVSDTISLGFYFGNDRGGDVNGGQIKPIDFDFFLCPCQSPTWTTYWQDLVCCLAETVFTEKVKETPLKEWPPKSR